MEVPKREFGERLKRRNALSNEVLKKKTSHKWNSEDEKTIEIARLTSIDIFFQDLWAT